MIYIKFMRFIFKTIIFSVFALGAVFLAHAASETSLTASSIYKPSASIRAEKPSDYPVAVFAGGCFWCVESEFRRVDGVVFTRSGYAGGKEKNPTYEEVSSHQTGHREAVEVTYNPDKVSYRDLAEFFMTQAHDPTQADGQGPDIGPQYTSAIFYLDERQKRDAESLLASYEKTHRFKKPVATQILPFTTFYSAEDYHQQYYEKYQAKTGQPHINLWLRQQQENLRRAGE